jgi:hypothetical protein
MVNSPKDAINDQLNDKMRVEVTRLMALGDGSPNDGWFHRSLLFDVVHWIMRLVR